MKTIWRFWRIFVIALTAFPLMLSGCQSQAGRFISQATPAAGEAISAFGWVGISFKEPMDKASVEAAFSISPPTKGQTFWQDASFWFRPIAPLSQETIYTAQLSGEIATVDGQTARVDRSWEFTIRQPELIYFVIMDEGGEVWRAGADGSNPRQLSTTGGNVIEFAADRSGSWIAFSLQNEAGGRDLWLMDRDGENQRQLLACGKDVCAEPAWSMDQTRIA